MSYITHFKKQPVNVQYWDYYILCRLNTDATIALQRMEYWDGTKEDGNIHAENINDALIQQGQEPTQDTGNWIYKSGDELLWELMGVTGERRLPKLLSFLIDEVKYLAQRNNPINTWDRKKQYCVQRRLIQQHINYLGYIIDYFDMSMARMTPVFYAIEKLTAEKCYIDKISVVKVLEMLEKMKTDEKLPHFLKNELGKFTQTFSKPDFIPFRNFAEWIAQNCGMHSAKTQHRSRKTADSIPQKRGSNSIEDIHNKTNIESENTNVNADAINIAPAHSSLSEKKIEQVTPTPSTESEQTPESEVEKKPTRKRAPRKPRAKGFEVPEELVERVNKFYEFLNGWAVKKTGLQQTWFAADDESNELICALLTSRTVTQKTIEQVCNALWDEPKNTRNGYWAREHMTVKAIINAYKAKSLMFAANETKATTTPAITQPYSLAGYTYKPEEAATTDLPFAGPLRLRNKKRGA